MPTLQDSARRAAQWRWLEERLFETVGGWVPSVPEPEAKLALATQSFKHAWHARLWQDRLPERSPAGADATEPGPEELAALVEALAEPARPDQTIEKLVGLYRVLLPRMAGAYRNWLEELDPWCDGPGVRCVSLVLADELEDWRAGERLVQSLLRRPGDAGRAAAHQARLESLVLDSALA